MLHYFVVIFSAFLAIAPMQALSVDSLHSGYWQEYTPGGGSYECQGVSRKKEMEKVLKTVGWDMEKGVPRIDWSTQDAVIVAPGIDSASSELRFYGLFRESGNLVLSYGWKQIQGSKQKINPDGSVVTFQYSTASSEPSTIVVSYPRSIATEGTFYCVSRS